MPDTGQSKFEKQLLRCLKKLGDEKIEHVDPETGDMGVMTRAEALTRTVWREALGYSVYVEEEDGKRVFKQYVRPDKASKQLIFDHLLGKPKMQTPPKKDGKEPKSVPLQDKISESLVAHINSFTESGDADSGGGRGKDKAGPKNPISERMRRVGVPKNRASGAKKSGKKPSTSDGVDGECG